jgi:hypothetical protein
MVCTSPCTCPVVPDPEATGCHNDCDSPAPSVLNRRPRQGMTAAYGGLWACRVCMIEGLPLASHTQDEVCVMIRRTAGGRANGFACVCTGAVARGCTPPVVGTGREAAVAPATPLVEVLFDPPQRATQGMYARATIPERHTGRSGLCSTRNTAPVAGLLGASPEAAITCDRNDDAAHGWEGGWRVQAVPSYARSVAYWSWHGSCSLTETHVRMTHHTAWRRSACTQQRVAARLPNEQRQPTPLCLRP